jgi:hypothetical protein
MAARDVTDGAIAGLITGVIIAVLTIVLGLIGLASLGQYVNINRVLGGYLPGVNGAGLTVSASIALLVFLAVVGLILGIIYGALFEGIPTLHPVSKGIVLLVALWVVFGLIIPLLLGFGASAPAVITFASIVTSLIAAIIWGAVLGAIFIYISRRVGAPTRPVVRTP